MTPRRDLSSHAAGGSTAGRSAFWAVVHDEWWWNVRYQDAPWERAAELAWWRLKERVREKGQLLHTERLG